MDGAETAGKYPVEGQAGLCTLPCRHEFDHWLQNLGMQPLSIVGELALGSHLLALRKPPSSVDMKGGVLDSPWLDCKFLSFSATTDSAPTGTRCSIAI